MGVRCHFDSGCPNCGRGGSYDPEDEEDEDMAGWCQPCRDEYRCSDPDERYEATPMALALVSIVLIALLAYHLLK